jgi:hypothetical protein
MRTIVTTNPRTAAWLGECGWTLIRKDYRGWILRAAS